MTMGTILYFNKYFVHQLFIQNPEMKSLTLCTLLEYIYCNISVLHNNVAIQNTLTHIANAVHEHTCVHYVDGNNS